MKRALLCTLIAAALLLSACTRASERDLIEPISIDEAFLDVTQNKKGIELAVDIAKEIKTRINSFLFDTEFIYKASRRKEINLQTINANIKEGLAVSNMGFKVLRREALNFLSILFHRD